MLILSVTTGLLSLDLDIVTMLKEVRKQMKSLQSLNENLGKQKDSRMIGGIDRIT